MDYILQYTKSVRRDIKRAKKRSKDIRKLYRVLKYIRQGIPLPVQFRNHRLWQSEYKDAWEVHIEPNWLLVYQIVDNTVLLMRSGTHPDIFG